MDSDFIFDLGVQYYDGEGLGSDTTYTLDNGDSVSHFENGIMDTIMFDFGADGAEWGGAAGLDGGRYAFGGVIQ